MLLRNLPAEVESIKAFLRGWFANAIAPLSAVRPEIPPDIDDGRQIELSEPIIAIGDMAGGEWPGLAREAMLAAFQQDVSLPEGAKLLRDIRAAFEIKNVDRFRSSELVEILVSFEESDWAIKWERDMKNGQTMKPRGQLAKMLGTYGIHPKSIRFEDYDGTAKGYTRDQFVQVWERYTPNAETTLVAQELKLI
jgi:hypothetical protein